MICGTLCPCFIMTHIHNESDLQIYFCVKFFATRPTSHLDYLFTIPFHLPREHWLQHIWFDDFSGQCLLWGLSSRKTFFALTLGLPTNVGVERSWLFVASSIKFLTRMSLISQWVYLAPHEITVSNWWVLVDPEIGKIISWSSWSYVVSSSNWRYDRNCRHKPCASCTVPRCEDSWFCCFCHKNFLLLAVGLC